MELTCSQWFSVVGLSFDIIGALFVGYEVMNQYRGKLVEQSHSIKALDESKPVITDDYKKWEKRKYKFMAFGLGFLLVGFSLQIAGIIYFE